MKKTQKEIPNPLPAELYSIIACPVDKSDLKYTKEKTGLQCVKCKYIYPIKEGIPILLPPELQEKNQGT
ncbi:Trm112 family protein [Candidatus Woesearchaeota archaeon]|nr:Trm112 family protein [Candidatus Woesearchaeota archaeon]